MDGLLSPRPQRARSKPNLNVSGDKYKEALHALLLADPPVLNLRAKLGPELAQHQKQVTPGHLMSLEKLWYPLISSGCKQLVLQSQKIRAALHLLVAEHSLLIAVGTPLLKVPIIINDVTSHIMECASVMRAIKNEGMPGVSKASSDLASSVKRKMVGLHLQILGPIITLMQHSDVVTSCPLSPPLPPLIPELPPSRLSALGDCTPTASAKLEKTDHTRKVVAKHW